MCDVKVSDYIPDADLPYNAVYVWVASLKTEKLYESFDLTNAEIAEIDFYTITGSDSADDADAAYAMNAEIVGLIERSFTPDAAALLLASTARTDITGYENPRPTAIGANKFISRIRIRFTVFSPYAALE